MKILQHSCLLLLILLFINKGYSQTATISIKTFADTTIEQFDDSSDITTEKSTQGFSFRISSALAIDSVFVLNAHQTLTANTHSKDSGNFRIYQFSDPFVDSIRMINIRICRKDKVCQLIRLFVSAGRTADVQNNARPVKDDCSIFLPGKENCGEATLANDFGFSVGDYSNKDVIYVYDFNRISSKRRFYKLEVKKGAFVKTKVNFTTELLKPKQQVWVKVANVNRFKYNVDIQHNLVDYSSEPSALFNQLFLGQDSGLLGDLITSAGDNAKSQDALELQAITNSAGCFKKMYLQLRAEMFKAYDPCSVFACCNSIDFDKVIRNLQGIDRRVTAATLKFKDIPKKVQKKEDQIKTCVDKNKAIAALNEEIKKIRQRPGITKKQRLALLAPVQKKLSALGDPCPQGDIDGLKGEITEHQKEIKLLEELVKFQSSLPKEEDITKIGQFVSQLVEQNQSQIHGQVQLRGNRLDLSVVITSIDSAARRVGFPSFKDSMAYEIPIIGQPFVSFSSGTFVAIGKYLSNKTYDWQALNNGTAAVDSVYRLSESGYTAPDLGFAALGNIEWKFNRNLGIGISGGVGITIEKDPRVAYLLGGSLFLGDTRQFAITGGFAAMPANRLKTNFQSILNDQITYPASSKPTIEYYKELKVGAFISLTYTPFKTVRRSNNADTDLKK